MTMQNAIDLLPLFQCFIKESRNGRRRKPDGTKIKSPTIDNYACTFQLLEEFAISKQFYLRIKPVNKMGLRQVVVEKNYWRKFYRRFTDFLYKDKQCYDNYVGHVIKNIKTFFNYIEKEKFIDAGDFFKSFYATSEDISIVTLDLEQLKFLINNVEFEAKLPPILRQTKQIFVFGCTVALRFSDLFNIRFGDIHFINGIFYLAVTSIKTGISTKVRLPSYAVEIIEQIKFNRKVKFSDRLFNKVSLAEFNKRIQQLGELAGWTFEVGKRRAQLGQLKEQKKRDQSIYRFCDRLSSHVMRRTAITTMLMLGVPEDVVRKISGHAPNSQSFFRYINYTQAYMDTEVNKLHSFLAASP